MDNVFNVKSPYSSVNERNNKPLPSLNINSGNILPAKPKNSSLQINTNSNNKNTNIFSNSANSSSNKPKLTLPSSLQKNSLPSSNSQQPNIFTPSNSSFDINQTPNTASTIIANTNENSSNNSAGTNNLNISALSINSNNNNSSVHNTFVNSVSSNSSSKTITQFNISGNSAQLTNNNNSNNIYTTSTGSDHSSNKARSPRGRPVPPPVNIVIENGQLKPTTPLPQDNNNGDDEKVISLDGMTTRLEKLDINGNNRSRSSSGSTEIDIDTLPESYWKDSDLMLKQIKKLSVLGEGSSGKVFKSVLKKKIFALKCITFMNYGINRKTSNASSNSKNSSTFLSKTSTNDNEDVDIETKQILRELKYNTTISSENIVSMYGMFYDLDNIYICMEYMGGGSLDTIYKALLAKGGRVSEKVLGKIAESGFSGLAYLHQQKIIHRDIKPSNILVNTEGQIKLCDFGVSGDIVNSLATTFTGTSFYMAPERIQGQPYTVTSDVWSMGLTLLEVAEARFPLRKSNNNDNDDAFNTDDEGEELPPIELLMMILNFKPELTDYPEYNLVWSKSFKNFIEYCLKIDSMQRPSPRQMLNHPWMQGQMKKKVNMAKFIAKCLD